MSDIFLDAETIPALDPKVRERIAADIKPPGNYKKAETIAEWWAEQGKAAIEEEYHKTCFDGGLGHVVVVSIAVNDEAPVTLTTDDWTSVAAERVLLDRVNEHLSKCVNHHAGHRLIGHGISFDRRFLRQRGIVHRRRMHPLLTKEVKPWDQDTVFDTMTAWTGDARERISMDRLCSYLGIEGKGDEIDGSKVWAYVQAGRIHDVANYCAGDVRRARLMFNRLTFKD